MACLRDYDKNYSKRGIGAISCSNNIAVVSLSEVSKLSETRLDRVAYQHIHHSEPRFKNILNESVSCAIAKLFKLFPLAVCRARDSTLVLLTLTGEGVKFHLSEDSKQVKDEVVGGDLSDIIRPGEGRGLDFVKLSELSKRTGVTSAGVLGFALSELLANALDTDALQIKVSLSQENEFYILSVSDDGKKILGDADVRMITNFENNASSKRGIFKVQRGALGNALKCIFGYTYAIPESIGLKPHDVIVRSHGTEYKIRLVPDRINEKINKEISKTSVPNDGSNAFVVAFPIKSSTLNVDDLVDLLSAVSLINPNRRIQYNILEREANLGNAIESTIIRRVTSILWYRIEEHEKLFFDYVRADPRITLAEYIALFRGFSGRERQREILHTFNASVNHDSNALGSEQFLPSTPISDIKPSDVERLYSTLMVESKPVERRSVPSVLGMVGKATLESSCEGRGWRGIKYGSSAESHTSGDIIFPYIIEIAVFDRAVDDTQGLKVYHCINFMASTEKIHSEL